MWQGLWKPPLDILHTWKAQLDNQAMRTRDAVPGGTHTSQSWRCQDARKTNFPATMDSVWGWVKDATSWLTAKMSLMKKVATSWRYWMGKTRRSHHTFWMTLLMCQFQFSFSNWLISTRRITQLRSASCGKTKGWHSTKTSKSCSPYRTPSNKQSTKIQVTKLATKK